MEGRSVKFPAYFVAAILLMAAGSARGQAMVQVTLDAPAEPAMAETTMQPVVTPASMPALPSFTVSNAAQPGAGMLSALAASTEPAASPRRMDEAAKVPAIAPVTVPATAPVTAPVNKTTDAPDVVAPAAPSVAATAPAAANKVSIESRPIHAGATTAPSSTPAKAAGNGFAFGGIAQVGAALAVVIGLILIFKALARKFVPGAKAATGKGVIEILARHALAKNQAIVLVRIGSQIVALNQGRESSESVLVINDAAEVARIIGQIEGKNPDSMTSGFNKLLANARMDLEEAPAEPELRNTENLDEQLEEMAAAKRQLMELRQHVRSVRDRLPRE